MYKKFFQPKYGEPSPEVVIDKPQVLNMRNIAVERHKMNLESVQELVGLHKKCSYYTKIMGIKIENKYFQKDGRSVGARIYYPDVAENSPVMIFYHGGGFIMNNLDVYDHLPRYFAKYGNMVVVSIDYRLAPEYKFPAAMNDAYDSLEWVVALAKEKKWNVNNICVCGDSAGGNLAAVVALRARNESGPKISKQILMYPLVLFNLQERTESEVRYGNGDYFIEIDSSQGSLCSPYLHKAEDGDNIYASPLLEKDLTGLPETLFLSAECDPLFDHALFYAEALKNAGVGVSYVLCEGMIHGFLNRPYQKTFEAFDAAIKFIHK